MPADNPDSVEDVNINFCVADATEYVVDNADVDIHPCSTCGTVNGVNSAVNGCVIELNTTSVLIVSILPI